MITADLMPIRPPLLIETNRAAKEIVASQEQPGRVESGTGTTPLELPETGAVKTSPRTMAQANMETERVRPSNIATHDPQQSPVTSHVSYKTNQLKHTTSNCIELILLFLYTYCTIINFLYLFISMSTRGLSYLWYFLLI